MIRLEAVNPENWRIPFRVAESQKAYVASSAVLLARAFAYRDSRSEAYVIFDEDTPVGMVLYYDCDSLAAYIFSELFIDERYQRQGYGRAATQLVLDRMKKDGKYQKVCLCYIEGNEAAKHLYESLGFREVRGRNHYGTQHLNTVWLSHTKRLALSDELGASFLRR